MSGRRYAARPVPGVETLGERLAKIYRDARLRPTWPPQALPAWHRHLELLYDWNPRYNLTAVRDPAEAVGRLLGEAVLALPLLEAGAADLLVDLGSGNGYPALPLLQGAVATRGVLFEAREAKAAFLRAVIRDTGLAGRAAVEQRRIEGPADLPEGTSIVTLRGFPDPVGWIPGLIAHPGVRLVVAWMAREDAARAAEACPGRSSELRPIPGHQGGVIFAVR